MRKNYERILLVIILVFISFLFLRTPGTVDVSYWLKSIDYSNQYGIIKGYAAYTDALPHPPGMSLILFISAKISTFLGLPELIGIKLSLYFFLFLTLIVLYKVTDNYFLSIIAFFFLVINSLGLIYLDIYFAPFLILSLFFIKKKNILLSTVFYCLATMIKLQVIILMPFFVLQIVNINSFGELKDIDYKKLTLNFILPFALMVLAVFLIYGMPLLHIFQRAYQENMLSGQGANLGWIMTFFLHYFFPESFGSLANTKFGIGMIRGNTIGLNILKGLFFTSFTIIFLMYFKLKDKSFSNFLLYTIAGFLSYFIFNKGVHENHLHIAVLLFLMLYGEDKDYLLDVLIWGILFNINMVIYYSFDGTPFRSPLHSYRVIGVLDLTLLLAVVSVAAYFIFSYKYIFKNNVYLNRFRV